MVNIYLEAEWQRFPIDTSHKDWAFGAQGLGWGELLQLARPEVTAGELSVQTMALEEPEGGPIDEDGK